MSGSYAGKFRAVYCFVLAMLVVFQIGLGYYMTGLSFYHRWYHSAPWLHKSVGILILLMAVLRLSVRLRSGVPPLKVMWHSLSWDVFGVRHLVLYFFILMITSTGYIFATSKGDPVSFFDIFSLPAIFVVGKETGEVVDWIHYFLAYTLAGLIVVHSFQMLRRWLRKKPQ